MPPTYTYQCPLCEAVQLAQHTFSANPYIPCPSEGCASHGPNTPLLDDGMDGMQRVTLFAPAVNIAQKDQASPNANKIHGAKPLKDIVIHREDDSGVDVIKAEHGSNY